MNLSSFRSELCRGRLDTARVLPVDHNSQPLKKSSLPTASSLFWIHLLVGGSQSTTR